LALPIVQRALQEDAESPLLQQTQFRVLADLGDVDGIRRAGERWLRSAPSMEAAYRDYATALGRVGELAEAERVLRLGLERVRQREVLYSALADVYISQRRWPDVATQWLSMLEAAPGVGWDLIGFNSPPKRFSMPYPRTPRRSRNVSWPLSPRSMRADRRKRGIEALRCLKTWTPRGGRLS
jgi:hypothetical protein